MQIFDINSKNTTIIDINKCLEKPFIEEMINKSAKMVNVMNFVLPLELPDHTKIQLICLGG